MDSADLLQLLNQLGSFAKRHIDRDTLRRWFLPFHTAPLPVTQDHDAEADLDLIATPNGEESDSALFWQLVWLFEGEATEERHRDIARRIATSYSELQDSAAVLGLLSLIIARDRFCSILSKHRAGIVSRVGLLSVIGKTFPREYQLTDWLKAASLEDLEDLCQLLDADDYAGVITRVNLPSA
jgi:hypothetical protein